jgi:hypothetical protein
LQSFVIVTFVIVALLAWPLAVYTGTVPYLIAFCAPFAVAAVVADELNTISSENE